MRNLYGALLTLATVLVLAGVWATPCYGNAAAEPSIVLIVPDAPEGLEISIASENEAFYRTGKAFEVWYVLYSYRLQPEDYVITVTHGGESYDLILPEPLKTYENIYTLDLETRTVTEGKSLSRSAMLVSIRVAATLLLEGIVFFLFGFRQRRSWLIFLVTNLITQAGLHAWLNLSAITLDYDLIFQLLIGEFFVFLAELAVFLIFVREKGRLRTGLYVILANLVSLVAGGWLIGVLPV